jgi:hypothetical protein
MSKILQINYRLSSPINDFLGAAKPVADLIANIDGLKWKIWLKSEDRNEGGGIYLFESETALDRFVNGPVVERLKTHPDVDEVSTKVFDTPADLSAITQAPV